MTRNHLLIGVIVLCVVITGFVVAKWLGGDPHANAILKDGPRTNVACMSEGCGFESGEFRAHIGDADWPKECPKCQEKTLYKTVRCHVCDKMTSMKPAADNGVYCQHCKAMILDPNAPKFVY